MTDANPKRSRRFTREQATSLLDVAGMLLVSGGVAAIYWPAALILTGLAVLAMSWRASR